MSQRILLLVIAVLGSLLVTSIAVNALFYVLGGGLGPIRSPGTPLDRVEVLRTVGGVLQVSTIRSPEYFTSTKDHTILGVHVGHTTSHIRVPASYSYGIELAREWKVRVQSNGVVIVIAPPAKPMLPVPIDTSRLERHAQGRWSAFTGDAQLDALQSQITPVLADKAKSPSYIGFQREAARKTVGEFVRTWLLTQERYRKARSLQVRVFFADEPVGTMEPLVIGTPADAEE